MAVAIIGALIGALGMFAHAVQGIIDIILIAFFVILAVLPLLASVIKRKTGINSRNRLKYPRHHLGCLKWCRKGSSAGRYSGKDAVFTRARLLIWGSDGTC